ncbi:MAG: GTP-binding protein, partial [Bacteroidetes bacterium]
MRYIPRNIGSRFRDALESFPAVLLTGPRQSGKTTFLKEEFGKEYPIRYLDEPRTQLFASEDPISFLESNPPPIILDEIQYLPQLLPYIKRRIDDNRTPGQWILTGSQQFQLMQKVTESLAGRIAILTLLPFSLFEVLQ